jgi:hypothetical protein
VARPLGAWTPELAARRLRYVAQMIYP